MTFTLTEWCKATKNLKCESLAVEERCWRQTAVCTFKFKAVWICMFYNNTESKGLLRKWRTHRELPLSAVLLAHCFGFKYVLLIVASLGWLTFTVQWRMYDTRRLFCFCFVFLTFICWRGKVSLKSEIKTQTHKQDELVWRPIEVQYETSTSVMWKRETCTENEQYTRIHFFFFNDGEGVDFFVEKPNQTNYYSKQRTYMS